MPRVSRGPVAVLLTVMAALSIGEASVPTGAAAARSHKPHKSKTATGAFKPVPPSDHVALSFVSYLPLISAGAETTLNNLLHGFEKRYPNITVTVQSTTATTGAATLAAVQQDEAAGNTPDLVQSGFDMLRYLTTPSFGAAKLDKVVGETQLADEWGGDHPYPKALQQLGVVNGHQYSIPWVLSTPVLFYNETLFQKAGIAAAPKTWLQLEADALIIKSKTGADGLSSCADGASSSGVDWCTQAVIESDGGSVMNSKGQLTWTNPKTEAAVAELGRLGSSGAMVNLSTAQTVEEFGQGKLAMVINSSAAQGALLSALGSNGEMLDAPLPSFTSQASTPVNSGSGLTILAKQPLAQRAAWELIKYLTSDSAYTQITENIGYAPLRTSLVNDPKYLKSWRRTQSLVLPNLEQLNRLVPWEDYPGPNFGQIESLLETAVQSVAYQGQGASAALSSAQSQAAALLPHS